MARMGARDELGVANKSLSQSNRRHRFEESAKSLAKSQKRNKPAVEGGANCPILVEGKRDVIALRNLGFSGTIEKLNRGWDQSKLIAYLYEKYGARNPIDGGPSIIVLMDWDRTGGRLQRSLRDRLQSLDVTIDEELRTVLMKAMKPEGRTVESIAPHAYLLNPLIESYNEDE
tara:strand:+ start:10653 stop:11171 length:519 start_codon:yes stop_codon:yes gene_type:complete